MDPMKVPGNNLCDGDECGDDSSQHEENFGIATIGVWLDEKCLEPISASTRDSSRLCNACKHSFSEFQPFGHLDLDSLDLDGHSKSSPHSRSFSPRCRFLHSLDTLQTSARRGCAFCKLIMARLERNSLHREPVEALESTVRIELRGSAFTDLFYTYSCYNTTDRSHTIREEVWFHLTREQDEKSLNHNIPQHTDSATSGALIASWLRRCVDEHPTCGVDKANYTLPTRLVDLRIRDNLSVIRITETNALRKDSPYIALSHCWGGNSSLMLESDNADYLKQGIDLSELPLSFQHAVSMTRFLGIHYLWIDSLCIIQNSRSDWEREASRMKDVYKNALLTIAATGAEDSNVGLYFKRELDLLLPVFINISWVGLYQGMYKAYDRSLWEENVDLSPLSRRAWVVQERLLSRRTVHFGQDQVAWECQELQACETFPDELLQASPWQDLKLTASLRDEDASLAWLVWPKIAESYSSGQLTQEDDKCIAISGIAEEIHTCTRETYVAGMWRSWLVPQMCWTSDYLANGERGIISRRPSKYRAPSWSWLSVDSRIEVYYFDESLSKSYAEVFEILDVKVETTSQGVFGSVRSAHIVGRGMLRPGRFEVLNNSTVLALGDRILEFGRCWNIHATQYSLDVVSDEKHDVSVWCLPLLLDRLQLKHSSDDLRYVGIILVEAGGKTEGEYRRIGCFQLGYDSSNDFLKLRVESPPQVSTKSIFTIV